MEETRKIAMNLNRRPHRGLAVESTIEAFDKGMKAPWMEETVKAIREGCTEKKTDLPFRCAHYYGFRQNHRAQTDIEAEKFLFQTVVDYDAEDVPKEKVAEEVEKVKARAIALNEAPDSVWKGALLRGTYSARRKLHLDIRIPLGKTIHEAQVAYCQALGIVHDVSCETPERMLYETPLEDEWFRAKEWCLLLPEEELAARRKAYADRGLSMDGFPIDQDGKTLYPTRHKAELPPQEAPEGEAASATEEMSLTEASATATRAFDLCVEQAGLKADEMDVWGVHNWHTNLMAVLSVGLPKLMSKEQVYAVVRERLPHYAQTEDCRKLIEYFYDKYTADKGFMSVALRAINAKAQRMSLTPSGPEEEEAQNERDVEMLSKDWTPIEVPKRIPRLMELLTANYDPRFRPMLLLASLPILAAHASHFRAQYLNGKVTGPQQYVAVIGASGSGKGNCTELYREMVEHTLQNNDDREWEKVREIAELRDRMANAKERPPKYHPKLRLFESTSKSSILELQTNLGKNGMLLGQFSEVDGLSATSRAAFSDISVLLRKGWDGDIHRQFYMSDSTCNTYTTMCISLLMAGTVKAMLERMFSDNNCEGGFMQRCIPVIVPQTKRTFRPPCLNRLTEEERQERDNLLLELYQKDLELGEETQTLDLPLMNHAIGEWFDSLEERYNDGMLTEAEADLSHRCGEFMLRAAIPLVALYGEETKEIVDFCRWVGESAHYTMCHIFGLRVQRDLQRGKELLAPQALESRRSTMEPLLQSMPEVFTIAQFQEQRVKMGLSPDVRMLLSRYRKKGKVERIARGLYRKCKCNT